MTAETAQAANTAANLELNKGDDFIIALDISGSMKTTDCPNGVSRLAYTLEQFGVFANEAAKWDTDGVSLYAFGANVHAYPDISADKIASTVDSLKARQLEGLTMTHLAVTAAWKEHLERKNEQTVLMIFTDGEPSDQESLLKAIAEITQNVKDEREFNISFITVANRTPSLEAFLATLDDGIPGAKYDIVDVKRLEDVDFFAAFDGALND